MKKNICLHLLTFVYIRWVCLGGKVKVSKLFMQSKYQVYEDLWYLAEVAVFQDHPNGWPKAKIMTFLEACSSEACGRTNSNFCGDGPQVIYFCLIPFRVPKKVAQGVKLDPLWDPLEAILLVKSTKIEFLRLCFRSLCHECDLKNLDEDKVWTLNFHSMQKIFWSSGAK